jgi:diadenosine tetraphosphate (Ap4A) HIT family hydrolase
VPYRFNTPSADGCPACERIADGKRWPLVTESDDAIALVPSRQPSPGTTLVMPKRHVTHRNELSANTNSSILVMVRAVVGATIKATGCSYYHISQYTGALGGEPFDHLHWRIEPRNDRPPVKFSSVAELPSVPWSERQQIAHSLIKSLAL